MIILIVVLIILGAFLYAPFVLSGQISDQERRLKNE